MTLAVIIALAAASPSLEDPAHLDARIATYLNAQTGTPGGAAFALDRRLKLAACPEGSVISRETPAMVTVSCPTLGWRVRIPVLGASPVNATPVVRRGDVVAASLRGLNFAVTIAVTAQEPGATGQVIRVKSLTSGALSSARVTGPATVEIGDNTP
jgi:flagellar basal body P-ring formation protein FlgA